jgi:very-short-patch-repair endonuclease
MPNDPDQTCDRVAAKQHGLISREQAIAAGLTPRMVSVRLGTRRWRPARHCEVYAVGAAPATWEQSVMAACIWAGPGTVASHRAAAALWRLDEQRPGRPEVTTRRAVRSDVVVVVHRSNSLTEMDITRIGAIPATLVARTLLDLAGVVSPGCLEAAAVDACRRSLTSVPELEALLQRVGGRGCRGASALRKFLAEIDGLGSAPESPLELQVMRFLKRHRLPTPIRQFPVRDRGRLIARVDFAYPELRIAIEADGYRYHSAPASWRRDRQKFTELSALGWIVIYVTADDLRLRPRQTAAGIQRAIERVRPSLCLGLPVR